MAPINMKTASKLFVSSFVVLTVLVFVALFATSVSAAQNASYPSPSQCNGADWNIGSPDGATCSGSVTTHGSLDDDSKATSIFGAGSRLKPDLASMNKFCQQYTGESTSYATYGRMHRYCNGCDQNLSWYTGNSWTTVGACAGTLNVQQVRCATNCAPVCNSHLTKQCSGNSVYWYNSCGTKEDLFQTCNSNQTCQDAQCVNIACSTNSACGTNAYTGSPFCQSGNVYQNYKTYTCNNPGTPSSYCSDSTASQLKNTCTSNQTCNNGSCVDQTIACSTNSACGTNAYTGSPFCQSGNVYQNYITYTCNNAGTSTSYCSDSTAPQLKNTCTSNQVCANGSCNNQTITCSTNSACGTNAYTGSPFCQSGNVYQNYITYTCNNAGTSSSYCSDSTASQLKSTCTGNQTCTNGSCGTNCTSHSSQQCSGSSVYWYNSCGTQEELIQYCPNGCTNGYCTQNNSSVQTNSATNVYNNQATLNGYLYNSSNNNCNSYVWFQYGPNTSYGTETNHQSQNNTGSFSQNVNIYNNGNTTYHFRAVAQSCNGNTVYGQDMTLATTGSGSLTISKTVRNMTSGNSNWSTSTYASPSDTLMFMITIQATGSQSVNNVFVRDIFPGNLIYRNQQIVSGSSNYSGDITSGLSIGSISAGQTVTITYQAQVAALQNFSYGTTTLNNSVSVTSSDSTSNPTTSASVSVTRSAVYGASSVATGLTNNLLMDSFILPLMLALIGLWMFKSGMFIKVEKWADGHKKTSRGYKAEKELNHRIAQIREAERA